MSLDATIERAIITELTRSALLMQIEILDLPQGTGAQRSALAWAIRGQTEILGRTVTLMVTVDQDFPRSIPLVLLSPPDSLGPIPHVFDRGVVCHSEAEGLVLNTEDPVGIVCEAVARAFRTLEAGIAHLNGQDFMDDFSAYWWRVAKVPAVRSFLEADDRLRRVLAFKKGKVYESISETDLRQVGQFYRQVQVPKGNRQHHALYIPLKDGARLVPPLMGHLWTAQDVRSVIDSNLSPANQSALQRATGQCPDEDLVILSLPRPSGGQTLIGLLFQNIRLAHPLRGGQSSAPIPVPIIRLDRAQLMPRGGGDASLFEKRVMVAGCGAVGGFAALALARSGIGSVILVDPDVLQPENIFRHALGRSALGKGKATALKTEIEVKYPYVKVDGHQCRVEDLVSSDKHILDRFDALLLAVGNQGIELWANRWIHEQGLPFPAVFTWLEPYGIGGHALLMRPGQPGCYQCLIAPASSDTPLANRAAFARYGQIFARDDLGCGSQYVPYGALDAERTANLAVSLLLDALSGREKGNPIISWRGGSDDFAAHGFKVSRRYELSLDELYAGRYAYVSRGCPVCGSD